MKRNRLLKYILLGVIAALAATFLLPKQKQDTPQRTTRDYAEIKKEGIIRAAMEYNSISFYIDGDTVSGFHYELIEAFARDHGLKVDIIPEMSFDKRMQELAEGKCDIMARIPMSGHIDSLNVSVAAGILMYEFRRG